VQWGGNILCNTHRKHDVVVGTPVPMRACDPNRLPPTCLAMASRLQLCPLPCPGPLSHSSLAVPSVDNGFAPYAPLRRLTLKRAELSLLSLRGICVLTEKGQHVDSVDPRQVTRVVRDSTRGKGSKRQAAVRSVSVPGVAEVAEAILEQTWREKLLATLHALPPDAFERLTQRMLREPGFVQVKAKATDYLRKNWRLRNHDSASRVTVCRVGRDPGWSGHRHASLHAECRPRPYPPRHGALNHEFARGDAEYAVRTPYRHAVP
jgi:hypothetical protein